MRMRIRFNPKGGLPEQVSAFRCGAEHTLEGAVWDEDAFSEKEWARIDADPLLIVEFADDDEDEAPAEPPVSDGDLDALVLEAIAGLGAADMTSGGKPKVDVLQALLPEHEARIDSAMRDRLWERHQAALAEKAAKEASS